MKYSIATIILPSLEIDFIEEWIDHNLSIGFTDIHIYENGPKSIDKRLIDSSRDVELCDSYKEESVRKKDFADWFEGDREDGKAWKMKPGAHISDASYEDNMERLRSIASKYPGVHLKPWHKPYRLESKNWGVSRKRQVNSNAQLSIYKDAIENNDSDWWMLIDPDEFIWMEADTIGDLLSEHNLEGKLGALRLHQRVRPSRKPGVPVRSMHEYAYDTFNHPTKKTKKKKWVMVKGMYKTLAKSPVIISIHNAGCADKDTHSVVCDPNLAYINHYRGAPSPLVGLTPKGKRIGLALHQRYYKHLGYPDFSKIDDCMKKYI